MTSIIKLTAISGAKDESPPCYLLQIDEVHILLDCGWDEKFDQNFIKDLKKQVLKIDAVLLSYPDALHLGALPYLVGKLGLNCPIYATIPVFKMGQMFMYDLYMSHQNMYDFDVFTLDDVDNAFDKITQLKFNQSIALKGKGYGITITPLSAGHMIGGTIWKIAKEGEEDIVYATDFNHKKERHLNGCELEKLLRPSLFITDAYNVNYQQAQRRTRDEKLMTNILQTLRGNGNVLITVDTAGRVLELAHMLDQLWKNKDSGLMAYDLALLNNLSYTVIEFAKSQIEWMSEKLMKSFEGARNNPFQFRHMRFCLNMEDVFKNSNPKVVLASTPDMESGYSRELFYEWSQDPRNTIIVTSRSSPGTLSRRLIDEVKQGDKIELIVKRRERLQGGELEEFLRREGEKQLHLKSKLIKQDVESESDSDDDLQMSVITGKYDILVRREGRSTQGFFKSSRKQYVMFPFHEEKIRHDEYGEIIQAEDYRMADVGPDAKEEDNKENIKIEEVKKEAETKAQEEYTPTEKPTKCIESRKIFEVKANVMFIDFEGRSDGASLFKILSQLRPRRLIAIRGTPEKTDSLVQYCEQTLKIPVFAPSRHCTVDVTTETHIYQVRLTEALVSKLEFKKAKDVEVAWVDAIVAFRNKQMDPTDEDTAMEVDDTEDKNVIALEPVEENNTPRNFVFVNELRLIEFKQILMRKNIETEIVDGVLKCCNGTIHVKRMDNNQVKIDGVISEEYFKIRELLYEQFAII